MTEHGLAQMGPQPEFAATMNLGIYIQVPFCQTKCTYCNFHTGVFAKSLYEPYVDAICRELADRGALHRTAGLACPDSSRSGHGFRPAEESAHPTRPLARQGACEDAWSSAVVDTVYIGGGTPSPLHSEEISRILGRLRPEVTFRPAENTPAAGAETINAEKTAASLAGGVNRITMR